MEKKITSISCKDIDAVARVNMKTGEMEVNFHFLKLPIDSQKFIYYHELGHVSLNTKDEFKADEYAFWQYLKKGHSLKMATKTLCAILNPESKFHVERAKRIFNLSQKIDNEIFRGKDVSTTQQRIKIMRKHNIKKLKNIGELLEQKNFALAKAKISEFQKTTDSKNGFLKRSMAMLERAVDKAISTQKMALSEAKKHGLFLEEEKNRYQAELVNFGNEIVQNAEYEEFLGGDDDFADFTDDELQDFEGQDEANWQGFEADLEGFENDYTGERQPSEYAYAQGERRKKKEERKQSSENRKNQKQNNKNLIAEAKANAKKTRANAAQIRAENGTGGIKLDKETLGKAAGLLGKVAGGVTGLNAVGAAAEALAEEKAPPPAEEIPPAAKEAEKKEGLPVWAWVLIGLGAAAIVGGAIWFLMKKKAE